MPWSCVAVCATKTLKLTLAVFRSTLTGVVRRHHGWNWYGRTVDVTIYIIGMMWYHDMSTVGNISRQLIGLSMNLINKV